MNFRLKDETEKKKLFKKKKTKRNKNEDRI